jgi:hypothetical protein
LTLLRLRSPTRAAALDVLPAAALLPLVEKRAEDEGAGETVNEVGHVLKRNDDQRLPLRRESPPTTLSAKRVWLGRAGRMLEAAQGHG